MKVIRVDIDNTICVTNGLDYEGAKPIKSRIEIINKFYDSGDTIIYWTARGMATEDRKKRDKIKNLTIKQLEDWGCKFHLLDFDKPYYDIFFDDRAFNATNIDLYNVDSSNFSIQVS